MLSSVVGESSCEDYLVRGRLLFGKKKNSLLVTSKQAVKHELRWRFSRLLRAMVIVNFSCFSWGTLETKCQLCQYMAINKSDF